MIVPGKFSLADQGSKVLTPVTLVTYKIIETIICIKIPTIDGTSLSYDYLIWSALSAEHG